MDKALQRAWPLPLTDAQFQQLDTFRELLVDWNERMNLTAIVEEEEVNIKHFYDSLAISMLPELADRLHTHLRVIDVGTGAGFPGIPLAIAYPNCEFVLCDALAKRIRFLNAVCEQVGLSNVLCIHARSEDLARLDEFRGTFDVAVSRAVARMNVLMEYMAPFLVRGGVGVCYKGPMLAEAEAEDAQRAAKGLGSRLEQSMTYTLPKGLGDHALVVFRQVAPMSSKYPRKAGVVQRDPL